MPDMGKVVALGVLPAMAQRPAMQAIKANMYFFMV
jgi:hypothetical protein